MSATRLLILGALRFMQPAYGYRVRQELASWQADEWANIAYGSIYHALNKMAVEGLLEEVATEQQPGRPVRISYTVTDRGEAEFQRLLREYWWERKPLVDPFQVAVSFMDELPEDELCSVLRFRLARAEGEMRASDELLASPVMDEKPAHVRDLLGLSQERLAAEIRWLRRMLDRIEGAAPELAVPSEPAASATMDG